MYTICLSPNGRLSERNGTSHNPDLGRGSESTSKRRRSRGRELEVRTRGYVELYRGSSDSAWFMLLGEHVPPVDQILRTGEKKGAREEKARPLAPSHLSQQAGCSCHP